MADKKINNSTYDYTVRAASCDRNDLWGQVRRTINGVAVPQEQIDIIVRAINKNLKFRQDDALLDIGCGNGALTEYFFSKCTEVVGVDSSEYLIDVAKENFESLPNYTFIQDNAVEFVSSTPNPERFTKVLVYGVFSFFSPDDAHQILKVLSERFINVQIVFIGNIRDLDLAGKFYSKSNIRDHDLRDHTSSMGCWRTREEMAKLVNRAGWTVRFHKMPKDFYAQEYYYDVVLGPSAGKDTN